MAIFKEISPNDVKTQRSYLHQLIDIIQEDVSGSTSRKKYQSFVTGGIGPGITSSIFHTIYDQDFSLQTANAVFDVTLGLYYSGSTVLSSKVGEDSAGKFLFPSSSVMMREKIDVYKQFAQALLGSSTEQFVAPFGSTTSTDSIDAALFICFKRLFARDQIKRETFAMRWFQSASRGGVVSYHTSVDGTNLNLTSDSGSFIYTDVGSSTNKQVAFGGNVGDLVDSSNTSRGVGLIFYDRGIAVLDLAKIISGSQKVSGTISAMKSNSADGSAAGSQILGGQTSETPNAKFIPDFLVSGSMDNLLDHFCGCRFSSGSLTAMTFQNVTNINSTLIFARLGPDEFNYSSNPTYVDSDNRINVIDPGAEEYQQSFTFLTGVGLYDANDNLLAIAKVSRPIEKANDRDLTLRIRLDY